MYPYIQYRTVCVCTYVRKIVEKKKNNVRTRSEKSSSISFRTVDQIFATVREQMFFAVHAAAVGVPLLMMVILVGPVRRRRYLPGVHVQAVLALFREPDQERDEIVHDRVRYVLGQPFLFHAVFVQRCHEIRQGLRHPELDFQFAAREHQRVLRPNENYRKKKKIIIA